MTTKKLDGVRAGIGALLLLHGLAHARSGLWAAELGRWWAPGPGETRLGSLMLLSLWTLALAGFAAAGMGAFNLWPFRFHWRVIGAAAALASLALLAAAWPPGAAAGAALDAVILALLWTTRARPRTEPLANGSMKPA